MSGDTPEYALNSSSHVKEYWNNRARTDQTETSTTNDVYLRSIEQRVLVEELRGLKPRMVLDVGCGDGRTSAAVATSLPDSVIHAFDYSDEMVRNARGLHSKLSNLEFSVADCSLPAQPIIYEKYDVIFSTRCLINILEDAGRSNAISLIHQCLNPGGAYLMIENFIEGQNNFNSARRAVGLPEIPIRPHNRFFSGQELNERVDGKFKLSKKVNISSSYYLASRILYSKICERRGVAPDYLDDHHRFGALLPFAGDFGPVYLVVLVRI